MTKRKAHQSNAGLYAVAICVIIVVAYLAYTSSNGLLLQTANETNNEENNTTNDTTNNNYYDNSQQSTNQLAPTSLTVTVAPNPVVMGSRIYGAVISNGYNFPITIFAKLTGTGEVETFGGLLDGTGKFQQVQQMNTPGFWEFWATGNGVTSNVARLTVTGIRVQCERGTYSKTMSDSLLMKVYSTFTGNVGIIANDPAHAVSYPVTNCVVNSKGYGQVAPSLDFLPNGGYEMDGLIGGHKASDYSATYWVTVGR